MNRPVTTDDVAYNNFGRPLEFHLGDARPRAGKTAKRGEVLLPNALSSKIIEVASVMIGERANKMETIGIRPYRKIHEAVIASAECDYLARRGSHHAIRPKLPKLGNPEAQGQSSARRELSSGDNLLN